LVRTQADDARYDVRGLLSVLKRLLIDWLIPPGALRLWRRMRAPTTQKFWCGEVLEGSPLESAYFRKIGLAASTITLRDDSRNAAEVSADAALPLQGAVGDHVQLALAAERWRPEDKVMLATAAARVEHSGLKPGEWLDVRILCKDAEAISIHATSPLLCTMPRRVSTQPTVAEGIRHVIVLVLDGLTPFLAVDGSGEVLSDAVAPNTRRFFAPGFHARNGWASGEWTLPTTASFFTGLFTTRHRMYHPTRETRAPESPLLAELLQSEGFHTLALSTANRLTPAFGTHRGFDRFIYHWAASGRTSMDYDPARWCDEIMAHLDTHLHDKTFTYVQFPDTHPPWNIGPLTRGFNLQRRGDSTGHDLEALRNHPDAADQGRQLNAIRLHELDRLLDTLYRYIEGARAGETLVVLTADHGTPWAQVRPSRPPDEPYLVDQRIHIELRMRGPGVPLRTFDGLCSPNIDLMPTLLARLGLPIPDGIDGRDLLAPDYRRDIVVSESLYGGVYEIAVRDSRRTYIEKFRMEDTPFCISATPHYRNCFPAMTDDYGAPIDTGFDDLAAAAVAHRAHVKLEVRNG
jgi:arylsulfatase A-like enzyme